MVNRFGPGSSGGDLYAWNGPNANPRDNTQNTNQPHDGGNDPFANERLPMSQGDRPIRTQITYSADGSTEYINNFYKAANVVENLPSGADYRSNPTYDYRGSIPYCQGQQNRDNANYTNQQNGRPIYEANNGMTPDQARAREMARVNAETQQAMQRRAYDASVRSAGAQPSNVSPYYSQFNGAPQGGQLIQQQSLDGSNGNFPGQYIADASGLALLNSGGYSPTSFQTGGNFNNGGYNGEQFIAPSTYPPNAVNFHHRPHYNGGPNFSPSGFNVAAEIAVPMAMGYVRHQLNSQNRHGYG